MYNSGNYTLNTYKDSLQMEVPLLVCINKVKHKDPLFFSTAGGQQAECVRYGLVSTPSGERDILILIRTILYI